jgi:hypothetical protein
MICDPNNKDHMFTPWCYKNGFTLVEHQHTPNVETYWYKPRANDDTKNRHDKINT